MKKYSRSKILVIAHILRKKYNISFGEAQKISWKCAKLKNALHQGIVGFTYMKKDGTFRNAIGTLHNVESLFVGSDKFQNDILTLRYYDLEKQAFRALKINNLVSINY